MDNLSADMIQCKKDGFGCRYGAWKATQPMVIPKPKESQEGCIPCKWCGKLFKYKPRQKYCDIGCREEAYREKDRILQRERYEKRKEAKATK